MPPLASAPSIGGGRGRHHDDPRAGRVAPRQFLPRLDASGSHTGGVDIVPLTPEAWPALAELFSSGGDPRWCWCQYWRKPGLNWSNTTPDANRADLEALAQAGDPAPGL